MSLEKELALVDIEYACFAIPKFYGEEEKFIGWLLKVERVFACCTLNDQDKFKVVISRLRGYVLQWWQIYMAKRRKNGKEEVRTWTRMKSKLMSAFYSPTYIDSLLNKGSSIQTPKPTTPFSFPPQKNQTPLPSKRPIPKGDPKCIKCQGLGHLVSECPNKRYVTLAEWNSSGENQLEEKKEKEGEYVEEEVKDEEVKEEKNEKQDEDELEEIQVYADKGDMLTFDTPHPPKDTERRIILFMSFGEPPNLPTIPLHPIPKQFPRDQQRETIFKFKPSLFAWLIIFQPDSFRLGSRI